MDSLDQFRSFGTFGEYLHRAAREKIHLVVELHTFVYLRVLLVQPDGHGYELVSSVRALLPQKFSVEEELMHVKHVEVKSPHVGVMWKFGRGVISSGWTAAVAEWYRFRIVACLVTSSSPVPLKTRRVGQRCTLNLSRAETSSRWCGVVVRRGGASSGVVHVT
ncbi:uncharacterized protein TNCV_3653911 [Trichonephila clavipes]|nr:uncharacterized protein TNCV_3653911 [Trichonephila clavipes]